MAAMSSTYLHASEMHVTRPRTTWLAFALLGVLDAVLLLELPPVGFLLLVLAIGGMVWRRPQATAFAGLVTGIGGTWTALMLRVKISCEAFDAVPGQGCAAPDIDTWILIGLAILAIGILATLALALRERPRRRA
jgi:hypothetical protein